MLKKLLGLELLSALVAGIGFANVPANASGCTCNPCQCGSPCPCK